MDDHSRPAAPVNTGHPAAAAPAKHAVADAAAAPHEANGHRSVLVVEDDREINELVGAYAQIAGFEYRPALDGTSALREAHARLPAAVVLDLMLPDIDGFEVCKELKRAPDTRPVPVIMLTALVDEASRQRGRECGASEYLTKPFDPDRLMAALSEHAKGSAAES